MILLGIAMSLLASFSGNPVLGLLLLPLFFGGPFVLIWLEVRAFLKSEAQSWLPVALLIVLGALACIYGFISMKEFGQITGFMKTHLVLICMGAIAFPITLGWEAYKRGWLAKLTTKPKKKKRHSD
jgi:hypothetical protein